MILVPKTPAELAEFDKNHNYSQLVNNWNGYNAAELFSQPDSTILLGYIREVIDTNQINLQEIVDSAYAEVQTIFPSVGFEKVEILFWAAGPRTNAKADNQERRVVLNLTNIFANSNPAKLDELSSNLYSLLVHELTHMFILQLRQQGHIPQKPNQDWLNVVWEEGLCTLMEPTHMPYHYQFMQEIELWVDICKEWSLAESATQKQLVLNRILQHPIYLGKEQAQLTPEKTYLELLSKNNGFGYHVGYFLWQKQLQQGASIPQILATEGPEVVQKWLKQ